MDPERNLELAAKELRTLFPDIVFSAVYSSVAQYYENQPAFLNAVAKVETEKSPEEILRDLRRIEKLLHKSPPFRFGPRTIDLDLLLYDDLILPSLKEWQGLQNEQRTTLRQGSGQAPNEKLVIPHLRVHERRFVLEPLCELLDPHAKHPVFEESWSVLLQKTLHQSCDQRRLTL